MSTFFSIFVFFLELHPSSLSPAPEFFLSSSRLLSFMIYNCILLLLPLLSNGIGASGPLLSSSMVLKSGMKLEIPQRSGQGRYYFSSIKSQAYLMFVLPPIRVAGRHSGVIWVEVTRRELLPKYGRILEVELKVPPRPPCF
ncbi:uncharacterized protein [Spinacia oleracea]|uniref:Uncharacterized protein isoform X2 n=1 Tax=Spinacia oleracea TaxID=3562 RepID=A0ABM3QMX0_SPIOL|nr:uncharacterized protein LOC110790209 isoform X2 [Spinacia oleracea]